MSDRSSDCNVPSKIGITVRDALHALLSRCDGAHTLDHHGFNRIDAIRARDWYYKRHKKGYWHAWEECLVWNMLHKYREQLMKYHGINILEVRFEYTHVFLIDCKKGKIIQGYPS